MARDQATQIENNFILGLITEKTALSFPENASTDTDNCIFKQQGNVTRRLGLDKEVGTVNIFTSKTDNQVYRSYVWEAVAGNGNLSFLVTQTGSVVSFFDISNDLVASSHKKSFILNLFDYLPTGSLQSPQLNLCDFASGNGDLIVVNPVLDPFYVSYDAATDSITVAEFTINYRDFEGVADEYADNVRPAVTPVATLYSGSPNHSYNLFNQGWGQSDALAQWDTALATLPSNQDQVAMFRLSETDAFDVAKITSKSPGNTLAPRGHFILEAGNPQRAAVMAADGVVGLGVIASDGQAEVDRTFGAAYSFGPKFDTRLANAYDGTTVQAVALSATCSATSASTTIGRYYAAAPKVFTRLIIYSSSDHGLTVGTARNVLYVVYGKNGAAPISEVDGAPLASGAFNEGPGLIHNIPFSNAVAYEYIWVRLIDSLAAVQTWTVAEVKFYERTDTQHRFANTAFLAGRAFFAGIDNDTDSNKIYFSQIVNNKNQYGRCYQKNDPTNEYFFELLSDDGGVIKILEMGTIVRLFPMRSGMVIFATNGIWLINGSGGIKATDFNVKKLSSLGTTSPQSIVDVKGIPIWWAEDGIYTMQYDANYDAYSVVPLTQTTIKEFFTNIPIVNRKYVKGTYDVLNEVVYWMYNDGASLGVNDRYKYNSILCLNIITKAFYPWSFDNNAGVYNIRDIRYFADAKRNNLGKIKLLITDEDSASVEYFTFAEFRKTDYLDWGAVDYTSYFTTGYKVHGQTQRFSQANYIFVFLNSLDNSSCFMHTRSDWTNSNNSGKWSSVQQVYNPSLTYRDVNFRRLKVRGKGRSMQIHFTSETGKPFDILGWSIFETGNSGI